MEKVLPPRRKKRDFWDYLFTYVLNKTVFDDMLNTFEKKKKTRKKRKKLKIRWSFIGVLTILFCLFLISVPFLLGKM